jgi:hypothetical protein
MTVSPHGPSEKPAAVGLLLRGGFGKAAAVFCETAPF